MGSKKGRSLGRGVQAGLNRLGLVYSVITLSIVIILPVSDGILPDGERLGIPEEISDGIIYCYKSGSLSLPVPEGSPGVAVGGVVRACCLSTKAYSICSSRCSRLAQLSGVVGNEVDDGKVGGVAGDDRE